MPPQIVAIDQDLNRLLRDKFTSDFRTGYINVDGVCLPEYYAKFADAIENMEVRDDDIWVCSFPKTGTTWTQEMVWCIANDLDFDGAKVVLSERFPFLDHTPLFDYTTIIPRTPGLDLPELALDSVGFIDRLPSPRFIKTHLPFNLLPRQLRTGEKKPKIIYVARNAKDTCVSYYHHCKLLEGYRGDFDEFCSLFLGGKLCFAPFWKHVLGYWNSKDKDNFLFIKYEDMKANLASVIQKTAEFLGKSLQNQEIEVLQDHLSFASMKANPAVNYEEVVELNKKFKLIETDGQFMRSGKVNQWKGKMSDQVIEQFDRWTEENLKSTGLAF
ncbi:luciferin sulfotransferase-like [Nasonia vitripennis]|uniref:Sulfotransferase domain-containing protein n=1 Tax=Nasonia vitripennis TaxID=7425 RepID=A0A7M7GGC4_NASVI|nr:luciferin sulfotransferase-like [Nasonia vitripennis]